MNLEAVQAMLGMGASYRQAADRQRQAVALQRIMYEQARRHLAPYGTAGLGELTFAEPKPRHCKSCGAPCENDRHSCSYCGTLYGTGG